MSPKPQRVAVLGSTGSIGASTLDVMARHPERFRVFALTANSSVDTLFEQCRAFGPEYAVMADGRAADSLRDRLAATDIATEVLAGPAALEQVAGAGEVDTVMAAIVGAAGLESTLAAVRGGKRVLLANKESLVMAGALFMQAVRDHRATLLPIDSEHNAVFQCLPCDERAVPEKSGVSRIVLTASGGPFLGWDAQAIAGATPEQACAHPNWSMGRKISVDSATLMNKGLELAEACWLFDVGESAVEVVVHPQSVVHSMVQYRDGSVLAQMGNPDMRTAIAHGLAWPDRIDSGVAKLDIIGISRLDFEAPDETRFPCLALARESVRRGGTAPAILNAANEVAVGAFLAGGIGFPAIAEVIEQVLEFSEVVEPVALEVVKEADQRARQMARTIVAGG